MMDEIIRLVMFTLIFMVGSIAFLSFRGRATDIYVIWYINTFFFPLFYGLGVATKLQGVSLLDVCGSAFVVPVQHLRAHAPTTVPTNSP
jgi:hypothetical protein